MKSSEDKGIFSLNKNDDIIRTVYVHLSKLRDEITQWIKLQYKGRKICRNVALLNLQELDYQTYPSPLQFLMDNLLEISNKFMQILQAVQLLVNQFEALSKLAISKEAIICTWNVNDFLDNVKELYNSMEKEYQLKKTITGMSIEESAQSQRPYRYGMVLLCCGALINWLGLAEQYAEPVRYAGVACIVAGAMLICAAMCCWLQAPPPAPDSDHIQADEPIHVITMPEEVLQQKPPDYEAVAGAPPTYDDAIKLHPARLASALPAPVHPARAHRTPKTPPPPYRHNHANR